MKKLIVKGEIKEFTEEKAVDQFQNLVYKFSHSIVNNTQYYCLLKNNMYDIDDIKQICFISLIEAYRKYDIDKGVEFITLATMCIKNKLYDLNTVLKKRKDKVTFNSLDKEHEFAEDGEKQFYNVIAANKRDEYKEVIDKIYISELDEWIMKGKSKNRKIVYQGIKKGKTLKQISVEMGCSDSNVTRIRIDMVKAMKREFM